MWQVNWSALILMPIMEFLITNGHVSFKSKSLHLDEFFIYYDATQMKKNDWTHTFSSTDLARVKKRPSTSLFQQDLVTYSPINSSTNKSKRKFALNDSLNDTQSPRMPRTSSKKQNLTRNYNPELNQLDAKLDQFFEQLASEKENTIKFSQYLNKVDNENMTQQQQQQVIDKSKTINEDEKLDVGTSLELLLGKLQEEKRRNERFNHKLNEMFQ